VDEQPEREETIRSDEGRELPIWAQIVGLIAIPVVIPAALYWIQDVSDTRDRAETVANAISVDAMKGVVLFRKLELSLQDISELYDRDMADKLPVSGAVEKFLELREDARSEDTRMAAALQTHLLRFEGKLSPKVLREFGEHARMARSAIMPAIGDCVDKAYINILSGISPANTVRECGLAELNSQYLSLSIRVSEQASELGRTGKYDPNPKYGGIPPHAEEQD